MSMSFRQCGRTAAAALLLSLALSACGSSGQASAPPADPAASANADPAQVPITRPYDKLRPTRVRVPKIGADSSLLAIAVDTQGQIAVPTANKPMQAAWYRLSPVPGDVGPAIILGHVDGNHEPGVFYKLKDLARGDEILVNRSDGKELKFVVDHKVEVPKDNFPTDAVYGNTTKPELRLITCGGVFDHAVHSYKDNIVVYANLA
jgi:sortase (surface protein transpeptidase)/predicted small lipoprotein YifL